MIDTRKTIRNNLMKLFALLEAGKFIEAHKIFVNAEAIRLEENDWLRQPWCIGADKNVFAEVALFNRYKVGRYSVARGVSFYEAVMEYFQITGNLVKVEQTVKCQWQNGKIVKEEFFYASGRFNRDYSK